MKEIATVSKKKATKEFPVMGIVVTAIVDVYKTPIICIHPPIDVNEGMINDGLAPEAILCMTSLDAIIEPLPFAIRRPGRNFSAPGGSCHDYRPNQ